MTKRSKKIRKGNYTVRALRNKRLAMNQAHEDIPEFESVKNAFVWDSSIDDQNSNNFDRIASCLDCKGLTFENESSLHKHLIDHHLQSPYVLLQRLCPDYLQKLKQKKGRQRKGAFARKRSHSYIQPRVKNSKKSPLKLKLKVSGDSSSRSFEVVPQTVLIGPGGIYPLNGCGIGEVKTEDLLTDVDWNRSLEGAIERPEVSKSEGRTFNEVADSCEKENSGDSLGSNDDVLGGSVRDVSDLRREDGGDALPIEKEELDIPPSPEPILPESSLSSPIASPGEAISSPLRIAPEADEDLSPAPSDQLERELLHSDSESNFPQSPNMVEINNSTVADVRSPIFPTPSPSDPSGQPTPPSDHQSNDDQDESSEDQCVSGSNELPCEDDENDGVNTENFVWTDVATSGGDMNADNSEDHNLEERDPLLLNDNANSSTEECRSELQGSPNTGQIDGSDQSILRGFLSEHGPERTNAPQSGVGGLEGFGLGSEYISLERLGDNAVICDVCGERAADQTALQDHKFRSGHFKCAQPECGGIVFPTSDELLSHQQSVHGSPQFSQSNILGQSQSIINQQSAPVQQLVQQVQRLPVPQMTMQPMNKNMPPISAAMSQQLSSGIVTLISSQQNQFQGSVCRPPPLYPAPAANLIQQQQSAPPPYPGSQPQHMFPQPYPHGQYPGSPRQPVQMQQRPYSTMMQQMTQHNLRQQVPRVSAPNISRNMATNQGTPIQGVKRGVTVSAASPGNKQRRMDMLIPDRHDDADCHVIAMQKRTESGPVITGVQGSPASNSPGANRQPQSDSTINLTDSITLSVRQQNAGVSNGSKGRNDANTVASLLATRGITVTPAGGSVRGQPPPQAPSQQSPVQHRTRQPVAPPPAPPPPPAQQPVTTLNLNSAISIIPTASVRPSKQQHQQQQMQQPQAPSTNFAVPQGRTANRPQQQAQVERPPRPPTVDLTGDGPLIPTLSPMMGRGRGRGRGGLMGRHMCQLCDKPFPSLDALNQHMITHRPGKLPFRCNMCAAQYPTQQGLLQHRQTYHKESPSQMGSELVLPVVDLKQPATLNRLNSLGVRHYIPLSQLSNQSGGVLGLPIVSLEGGRIPSTSLSALGAATILTLGPLRQLPR